MQDRLESIRNSAYIRPALLCGLVAAAAVDWGLFGGVLSSLSATAIWKLLDPGQPDPGPELVNADLENEDIRGKLHEALVAGGLDTKIGAAIGNLEPGLAEEAWKAYTGFLEEQKRFLDKMAGRLEAVDTDIRRLITAQQQGTLTLALTPGHLHEYLKDWIPANLALRPELPAIMEALERCRIHKLVLLGRALSGKSILAGQIALRWLSKPGRAVALLAVRPQTEQFQALAGLNPDRHLVICDPDYTGAEPLTPEEMARFRNLSCLVLVCQRQGQPKFSDKEKTLLDHLRSGSGGDYHLWSPSQNQPPLHGRVMVTLGGVGRDVAGQIITGNVRSVFPNGGLTISPEAREVLVESMQALEGENAISIPGLARIVLLFIRSRRGPQPGEIDQAAARQILSDLGLSRRGLGEADYEALLQNLFTRIIDFDQEKILQVMARWQRFAKTGRVPRLALEAGYETKFKKNLNHEAQPHLRALEAAGIVTLVESDDSYRVWHPKQLDVLADDEPYETRYAWLKQALVKLGEIVTPWLRDRQRGLVAARGMADLCSGLHNAQYYIHELVTIWQKILELYRVQAATDKDAYYPSFAVAANNFGGLLYKLGKKNRAKKLLQESLDIRRKLVEKGRKAYRQDLAGTANNLGLLLSEMGELPEARPLLEEALGIYRELSNVAPNQYRPYVALVANNLGNLLRVVGELQTAKQILAEGLEIHRELAIAEPLVFQASVALSANNFGIVLKELGEYSEARKLWQESLDIRSALVEQEPMAYRADYAGTANNLGSLLHQMGELTEALKHLETSFFHYMDLYNGEPSAYQSDLAMIVNNLDALLRKLRTRESYGKLVDMYRQLVSVEPAPYLSNLAGAANDLGAILVNEGQLCAAQNTFEEALQIYKELSLDNQVMYRKYVAITANNLGNLLTDLGDRNAAREFYEESLNIRRDLAKSDQASDHFRDVATTANNLGSLLMSDTGERPQALELFKEAVRISEKLVKSDAVVYGPTYAMICRNYGDFLLDEKGWAEAASLIREAVVYYAILAHEKPTVFAPRLHCSLKSAHSLYHQPAFMDQKGKWLVKLKARLLDAIGKEETTAIIGAIKKVIF